MNSHEILLILAFFALVLVPAPFLGRYCFKVMEGQRNLLSAPLAPLERVCYRLFGVDPASEQDWKTYTLALLAFNLAGLVLLFSILMLQGSLPLNPQHLPGLEWTLAFNTAVSFVTNTNWQAYSGEASLSYFSQMVGLTVQNFVSAAVGLCVLVALARGISRRSTRQLGNFWVDLTRGTLYVLLPLCLLLALLLVWQGVPQTFFDYVHATTLQGAEQTIPLGPAASQIAIKQLGTNGGGFFGVNSTHPFENPSAWSNLFEVASIILIPAALVFTFGHYVKDLRQSRAILGCMLLLFCLGLGLSLWAEYQPNPALAQLPIEQGAPMEGKESRFGTAASLPGPASAVTNPGPHGFSQLLYAYTSGSANNGSAFAGFGANTPFHNLMIGLAMLIGRFGYILPILAIAGSLAAKKASPVGPNSFPTHGPLFVSLLTVTILLVGGLTFLPTLALGPIAEQLSLGF
ncbi:potassium-transporting ATPase subunit KdpA [Pseudomonas aeruginosa]|uniref:potassium-transporting ATPase subunit KdpA n=1 Tax=Pseudomonas aeruginosa TaxID=287 RepID=UPI0029C07C76|nr:potassium-transporting ATPase subunit KdpA [Pseudomonas aeruginosa]